MAVDTELPLWSARIARSLAAHSVTTVFQPIVDLKRKTVVGYEALSRFDEVNGVYLGPDQWFAAAIALDLTAELDAMTLTSAFRRRPDLPRNCFLSVNVDPTSLLDRRVLDIFFAQGHLGGIVIELTEHRAWDWTRLSPIVERLKQAGATFAMDDTGAGFAGLQQILELRPAILKLDRGLVDGVDHDEAKRALIEMLGIFASRTDAWILAEGIETPAEAQTLMELEVPLVQGYYFGRPGPAWMSMDPVAVTELRQIPQGSRDTLHALVNPVTALSESDSLTPAFLGQNVPWSAVVDSDGRPLGLLSSEGAATGVLTGTLVANVTSTPSEVGQRIATSKTHEPYAPIIVVDNAGRYLGLLSLRRLIRALSSSSE